MSFDHDKLSLQSLVYPPQLFTPLKGCPCYTLKSKQAFISAKMAFFKSTSFHSSTLSLSKALEVVLPALAPPTSPLRLWTIICFLHPWLLSFHPPQHLLYGCTTDVHNTIVQWHILKTLSCSPTTSLIILDPPNDLNVPIAFCKGTHKCFTTHLFSCFISYTLFISILLCFYRFFVKMSQRDFWIHWAHTMVEEMDALHNNDTWEIVSSFWKVYNRL